MASNWLSSSICNWLLWIYVVITSITMDCGLMWPVGISTTFQRPTTVSLHSPLTAARTVQGDCERVYLYQLSIQLYYVSLWHHNTTHPQINSVITGISRGCNFESVEAITFTKFLSSKFWIFKHVYTSTNGSWAITAKTPPSIKILCVGNHQRLVDSLHKGLLMHKVIPYHDIIIVKKSSIRHHYCNKNQLHIFFSSDFLCCESCLIWFMLWILPYMIYFDV